MSTGYADRTPILAVLALKVSVPASALLAALVLSLMLGCAAQEPDILRPQVPLSGAAEFAWTTIDREPIRSSDVRGRATLVLFVTMHELGSQLLVQQAETCKHNVVPRVNVVGVLMEGPEYAALAPAFRDGLSLTYPLVMAEPAMLRGQSPFGELDYLPTAVILDRGGREVQRFRGPVTEAELAKALERAAGK